jgi:uncharacterized protein GlcG (DUF336 family)
VAIAATPFKDTPSGPRALKGDVLPPFGMVDADGTFHPTPREVPPGFDLGPNRPPESSAEGPSLALATEAALAALNMCEVAGYRVGVAVIDGEGQAKVLLNADGTDGSHGFVAMRKAETSLVFKMPSSEVNERAQQDKSILQRVTPSMLLDGGALPIVLFGKVIGAIGTSGAAGIIIGAQDEICARAGLDAISAKLK